MTHSVLGPAPLRPDLALAARWVARGSRVLDVGCGDAHLLRTLVAEHGCTGTGIEIDPAHALTASAAGVSVLQVDVDDHLDLVPTDSFDVAVLAQTLSNVRRPAVVLAHAARIAPRVLVTMPNFALWRHRWRLLGGRMPMSEALPHTWYATPNFHFTTLRDLEEFFAEEHLRIERRAVLDERGRVRHWGLWRANLWAETSVHLLVRA